MAHTRAARASPRVRARRSRGAPARGRSRSGWRALRALVAAPLAVRIAAIAVAVAGLWLAVNWVCQVARKPAELFFPVSGALAKMPSETWRQYGSLFRRHSTSIITPELLAALAQVEGSGDPVARTYWRWSLAWNPFELYRPASSAVGMYQITDAAFREARRYCVRDHVVVESCWFNGLYTRVLPSHAVEMTAALLDRGVARILERRAISAATLGQRQDLAAVIHLCGAGRGDSFAGRRFRLTGGERCGDHDVGRYLARVSALKRQFAHLASAEAGTPVSGESSRSR